MKPRLLLYILLALAGAVCLYCGLKIHRHFAADDTMQSESLTVGLADSPLYTRVKTTQQQGEVSDTGTPSSLGLTSEWHPVSTSALLAVVGLLLLLAAGRMRKAGA